MGCWSLAHSLLALVGAIGCSSNPCAFCATSRCVNDRCVECADDDDCPLANRCVDNICSRCGDDSECGPGEFCIDGVCGARCDSGLLSCSGIDLFQYAGDYPDAPEPRGSRYGCLLIPERSSLEFFFGCRGFDDSYYGAGPSYSCDACLASLGGCAPGHACLAGDCTCTSADDCPGVLGCRGGFCGRCAVDEECGCGRFCSQGTCHPACDSSDDCPDALCDRASGRCVACLTDDDCGSSGAECYADGCVHPCQRVPCPSDQDCQPGGRCSECNRGHYPFPYPRPTACPEP